MKNSVYLLLISIVLLISCNSSSKDNYLSDYRSFVMKVESEYEEYTHSDWERTKEEFKKYSVSLYDKYENDLNIKEKLLCTKYRVQFNMYKLEKELDSFSNEDYDELREKIEFYYENDMEEDIEIIKEQAEKASEELKDVVEEIISEIEKK